MKQIAKWLTLSTVGLALLACQLGAQGVIDSINADREPPAGPLPRWSANEVGWVYTPAFDYALNGVFTKFGGSVDSRTVTLEVFDGLPNAGASQLAASSFTPVGNAFAGGYFQPVNLLHGHQYFVGFHNVQNLTVNISLDSAATSLDYYYGDGAGRYPNHGLAMAPILEFTTVPEPSTLWLLGLGILGLFCLRHK